MKQQQQDKEQFAQELTIQKSNSQSNKEFQDGKLDQASQGTNQINEKNKLLSHLSEQNKDSLRDNNSIGLRCGFNLDGSEILSHSPIPPIANPQFRSMIILLKNLEDLNNYKINHIENIFQDFDQIVQEIAKEDPLLILQKPTVQKIKRFSSSFFSVLNFTVRTDKSKQYMDRLIDQFDLFIESQYINNSSGKKQSKIFIYLFHNCQKQDLKLFVNILQLSGSLWSSFNKKIDYETFSRQITQVTQFMNSNKKAILQITSLFFDTTEYDISTISESMNISPKLLKDFAKVFLNKYNFDIKDFEQLLLQQTQYSETNKRVIRNIISINNGWFDSIMDLVKFSPLFQYSQGYQIFYQLLYSFDQMSIQSQKTEPNKVNILSLILLSPDREENKLMVQKILFRLCKEVIKEQLKKAKIKNGQLFIRKYSHLIEEKKNKEKNQFMIEAMNILLIIHGSSYLEKKKSSQSKNFLFKFIQLICIFLQQIYELCFQFIRKLSQAIQSIDNIQTQLAQITSERNKFNYIRSLCKYFFNY
ncbi:hypothetical protein TTHERM_000028465 (macronuclear) [Tetrahymena thermophila SB210]|uniref:Uncharacterized protein n=1 Tax=Tetrahymena thermophila (strain SB210) TaxID=312017 RepID=W7XBX8_TETTS|nr:hypothetical protein TTHERM_000028465 [Tetrahymena thermophila SB210]EWS74827.1 hypothetical protein TTHERM_000028465 [Tetrahymena thermophila SB210]|eukprot:XP_012652540.1 hypothetical protein TTHERM_000028465 [Tetrahymena thermophila SB210]